MLETIGNLILMLAIIGSGILITYVNVRYNPYITQEDEDKNND